MCAWMLLIHMKAKRRENDFQSYYGQREWLLVSWIELQTSIPTQKFTSILKQQQDQENEIVPHCKAGSNFALH